jgi:hypothetical protein
MIAASLLLEQVAKHTQAIPTTLGPYETCRAAAQKLANELGFDYGVEKDAFGYHHFMLPQRKDRYGHELACEVVSCENLAKCRPGHGPR